MNHKSPTMLPPLPGVTLATAETGIRYKNRPDLLLMRFAEGTQVAGVFTQSLTAAPPVTLCRKHLGQGECRAIIVNAGNANAFTSLAGEQAAQKLLDTVAHELGCPPETIFPASTGVIGEPLHSDVLADAIPGLMASLSGNHWAQAAEAIRTTDAYPKLAHTTCQLGGHTVTIQGIAKGAGMIAPNMATMLSFLATDASLPHAVLQPLLVKAARYSFNAVTVDGDTSTNDTVLLSATRQNPGGTGITHAGDPAVQPFYEALLELMQALALMIVRDGEGAQRVMQIIVEEAASEEEARLAAMAVANSPLVKTALAGADPNWGRIVAAVGRSGAHLNPNELWIRFGGLAVAKDGLRDPAYNEAANQRYMKQKEVTIRIGLGAGTAHYTAWGCDLNEAYLRINTDYRS